MSQLAELVQKRRVIVCAGAGGVGKTSMAAALSVAAARTGRDVVVLTVDPAKRLAEALGVDPNGSQLQALAPERAAQLGLRGSLRVKMMEPGQVWDDTVRALSASPEAAMDLLRHPLFRALRTHLAGAQDYMAMETVLGLLDALPPATLIVLDTPPSRHALDFLRGPARLQGALDTPLISALVAAGRRQRRAGVGLAARGASFVVSAMGRLSGGIFLQQLATLIALLNQLFGGLGERAERLRRGFLQPDVAFVLVTRPNRAAIADTEHFLSALSKQGLHAAAVVVNRCRLAHGPTRTIGQSEGRALAAALGTPLSDKLASALEVERQAEGVEAASLRGLTTFLSQMPVLLIPPLLSGVGELSALRQLASVVEGELARFEDRQTAVH